MQIRSARRGDGGYCRPVFLWQWGAARADWVRGGDDSRPQRVGRFRSEMLKRHPHFCVTKSASGMNCHRWLPGLWAGWFWNGKNCGPIATGRAVRHLKFPHSKGKFRGIAWCTTNGTRAAGSFPPAMTTKPGRLPLWCIRTEVPTGGAGRPLRKGRRGPSSGWRTQRLHRRYWRRGGKCRAGGFWRWTRRRCVAQTVTPRRRVSQPTGRTYRQRCSIW